MDHFGDPRISLPRSKTLKGDDLTVLNVSADGIVTISDGEQSADYVPWDLRLRGENLRIVPADVEAGWFGEANCITLTDGGGTAVYVPRYPPADAVTITVDTLELLVTAAEEVLERRQKPAHDNLAAAIANAREQLANAAFQVDDYEIVGVERSPTGIPLALLAKGDQYVGNATINLGGQAREAFWRKIDALGTPRARFAHLHKHKGATWVGPGLKATVRHLRGEEKLRHATILKATEDRGQPGAADER